MRNNGTACIGDFGTCRAGDLFANSLVGTPSYCAPELATVDPLEENYDGRLADVYSFGILALELWTETPPIPGEYDHAVNASFLCDEVLFAVSN